MPDAGRPPHPILLWWEGLRTWTQIAISYPLCSLLLFGVNLGPFSQPLLRSIGYGLFEGAILSLLLVVATAGERNRRGRS